MYTVVHTPRARHTASPSGSRRENNIVENIVKIPFAPYGRSPSAEHRVRETAPRRARPNTPASVLKLFARTLSSPPLRQWQCSCWCCAYACTVLGLRPLAAVHSLRTAAVIAAAASRHAAAAARHRSPCLVGRVHLASISDPSQIHLPVRGAALSQSNGSCSSCAGSYSPQVPPATAVPGVSRRPTTLRRARVQQLAECRVVRPAEHHL